MEERLILDMDVKKHKRRPPQSAAEIYLQTKPSEIETLNNINYKHTLPFQNLQRGGSGDRIKELILSTETFDCGY